MGAALIPAGVSLVGNLVGGGKAASSQSNATNEAATQQAQIMKMINNYIGQVSPTVQSLVSGLMGNTNVNQVAGEQQASSLSGFNGLKPEELSALSAQGDATNQSAVATAKSNGAFGANQNAAALGALRQGQQANGEAMAQIGSTASQQELGAQEAAGSLDNSLLNSTNSGINSSLSLLNPNSSGANILGGLSQGNQQQASSMGNPYGAATGSAGTLASLLGGKGGKGGSSGGYTPAGTTNNSLAGLITAPQQIAPESTTFSPLTS